MALTLAELRRWLPVRLEDRVLLDADPVADINNADDTDFINETTQFTVTFSNQGTPSVGDDAIGYGPFVDLTLESGIENPSATYLGTPVPLSLIATWEDTGGGTFAWVRAGGDPMDPADVLMLGDHPLGADIPLPDDPTGLNPAGTAWYQVIAPFGSYGPTQPALPLDISATLDQGAMPTGAVVDDPLQITARGGFRFGNDPVDNPSTDPPVVGTTDTATVTPTVYEIDKQVLPPPDTDTDAIPAGPNYPYRFRIAVDVANGLDPSVPVLTALTVQDELPKELFYTGNNSLTVNGVDQSALLQFDPATATLVAAIPEVFGTTAADEVVILIEAYTPEAAQLSGDVANQGDELVTQNAFQERTFTNEVTAVANYIIDPANPSVTDPLDPIDATAQLTAIPVSIDKTSQVVGGGDAVPGSIIEYTHTVSVSDFVVVSSVIVADTLDDGLLLDQTNIFLDQTPDDPNDPDIQLIPGQDGVTVTTNAMGQTILRFDLAQVTNPPGPIEGDFVQSPDLPPQQDGPVRLTVTYRAEIQDRRSDGSPVREGDTLNNTVSLSAQGDGITDPPVSDGDGSSVTVEGLTADKEIFRINGADPAGDFEVKSGDEVTFLVTVTLPAGDLRDFAVSDFPPLPIFDVSEINATTSWQGQFFPGQLPAAGEAGLLFNVGGQLGDDTANFNGGNDPTLTITSVANSLRFDFGDLDDPANQERVFYIAYTLTVADRPFADSLSLTNQAVITGSNTAGEITELTDLGQVILRQPELVAQKGIVSVTSGADKLDGSVGPTVFKAATNTDLNPLTGDLTSAAIIANPIDANAMILDAGDVVRFAVVLYNTGGEPAVDIQLTDDLAPFLQDSLFGLYDPTPGMPNSGDEGNLRVTYGDQQSAAFDDSSFFTNGQLTILNGRTFPTGGPAGLNEATTDGTDVIVITYDLEVLGTSPTGFTSTNTAIVDAYGAVVGGNNFLDGVPVADRPQGTATVDGAAIDVNKTVDRSSQGATPGNDALIGELIEYTATISLPEGAYTGGVNVTDDLPDGIQFVGAPDPDLDTLVAGNLRVALDANYTGPALTLTGPAGSVVLTAGDSALLQVTPSDNAETVDTISFDIASFSIDGTPTSGLENILTLNYAVRPLDNTGPVEGDQPRNRLIVDPANADRVQDRARIDIVEPELSLSKEFTSDGDGTTPIDTISAGDTVFAAFVLTNTDATLPIFFTVDATDLPALLDDPNASLAMGVAPIFTVVGVGSGNDPRFALNAAQQANGIIQFDPTVAAGDVQLNAGGSITLVVELGVDAAAPIGQQITNAADANGYSVPAQVVDGDPSVGREARPYLAEDEDTVRIDRVQLDKSIVTTSIGGDVSENVVIGEVVTYDVEITVPEGSANRIEIVDVADAGLTAVTATLIDDLTVGTTSFTPTADGFTLTITNVVNPPGGGGDNTAVVRVTARVDNVVGNQNQTELFNRVTQETFATAGQPANDTETIQTRVVVIEPELQITKVATPDTGVSSAAQVDYTLTIAHTGNSTSDAFDISLADMVDASVTIDPASLMVADDGGSGLMLGNLMLSMGNQQLSIDPTDGFDLANGNQIVIQYSADIAPTVNPGDQLTNTADITWTSIDGSNADERTGVDGIGGLNDYAATVSETVTVIQFLEIAKTADRDQAVIGEEVIFEIVVTLAEVTTENVVVVDQVPLGFRDVQVLDAINNDSGNAITFTEAYDPMTGRLEVGLGDVVITNDPNPNTVTVRYRAVVNDATANPGDTLTNDAAVSATNVPPPANASDDVLIIGPVLQVTKTATTEAAPVDAGNQVTYEVQISNTGNATAFDVSFLDQLPFDAMRADLIESVMVTSADQGFDTGLFVYEATTGTLVYDRLPGTPGIELSNVDLAMGATATITYTVDLADAVFPGETLTNMVTTEWSSLDDRAAGGRVGSDIDDASITLDEIFDLQKTITATTQDDTVSAGTDVVIGEEVTYELRLELSEGTTQPLMIIDQLPVGLQLVGTPSVTVLGGTGTATDNSTASQVNLMFDEVVLTGDDNVANNFVVVTYAARVTDSSGNVDGAMLTNTAAANGGLTGGDTDTQTVDVIAPDLALTKTVDGGEESVVERGGTVTYSIVLTNDGGAGAAAYDIEIVDDGVAEDPTLMIKGVELSNPMLTDQTGATAAAVSLSMDGVLTITADSLDPGGRIEVTITGTATTSIDPAFNAVRLPNTADLTAASVPDPATAIERVFSDSDDATVIIVGPDIGITKDVTEILDPMGNAETAAIPGGTVTYQILVENVGVPGIDDPAEDAPNVVVTETLPPGLIFQSATLIDPVTMADIGPIVPTVDPMTGDLMFDLGTIVRDTGVIIETVTLVDDPAPAGADLLASGGSAFDLVNEVDTSGIDGSNDNDRDDETVPLEATPDLVVTKDDGLTVATPGQRITYTITLENVGNQIAGGVVLTDLFDDEVLDFISADRGGTYDPVTQRITWTLDRLTTNDPQTFIVEAEVEPFVPAGRVNVVNLVIALDDGLGGPDPTFGNNFDTDIDVLEAVPDLAVTKTDGVVEVAPGEILTTTIVASNLGDQVATNVVVVDQLDPFVTFVDADQGGIFDPVARTVTWTFAELSPINPRTLTLLTQVATPVPAGLEEVVNRVSITDDLSNGPDPTPDNNSDTDTDVLDAAPDYVIVKTTSTPGPLVIGAEAIFALNVSNEGNQTGTGVIVRDPIPEGFVFVSATDGGAVEAGDVVWRLGDLAPGDSRLLGVTFQITAGAVPPTVENIAIVSDDGANGPDPTPENNRDEALVSVFVLPDLPPFTGGGGGGVFDDPEEDDEGVAGEVLEAFFDREVAFDPVNPPSLVLTGLAEPGSAVRVILLGADGIEAASDTAIADASGNWLLSLVPFDLPASEAPPDVVLIAQPNPVSQTDFVTSRSYFAPLTFGSFTTVRELTTEEVFVERAGASLEAAIAAVQNLALRTSDQPYVSSLQASSATASQS